MRCKNQNCCNITRTPNRVESYKKYGLCRVCAVERGLMKAPNNGLVIRTKKARGMAWKGHENKIHDKDISYLCFRGSHESSLGTNKCKGIKCKCSCHIVMRNRKICKECKVELETRHSRSIELCEECELL